MRSIIEQQHQAEQTEGPYAESAGMLNTVASALGCAVAAILPRLTLRGGLRKAFAK